MKIAEYNINISRLLQLILNFSLVILAILLLFFLASKTYQLTLLLFSINLAQSSYYLLEGILIYILYFEFIALIIKYFQSNYHVPLHYVIYIGITAIVCLIIIVHKSAADIIIYSVAILYLILALYIANTEK